MNSDLSFFNDTNHVETQIRPDLSVINSTDVTPEDFKNCCSFYENLEYKIAEENIRNFLYSKVYTKGNKGIFINYFPHTYELSVSIQENYTLSLCNTDFQSITTPQITQIHLEDFGMSYVIRLSDGKFIVIDGGWDFKPDAKRLYDVLNLSCASEKPVIAAWIMTHAHLDHYRCFNTFTDLYSDCVTVESVIFNFPDHKIDNREWMNKNIVVRDPEYSYSDSSEHYNVDLMYENIKKYNAKIFTPHTGQIYQISDATIEFLACIDDTYHLTGDSNSYCLVFRMTLGNQVILWTGDASFSHAKLSQRYGEYLKSDIMQVPHHGFQSGDFDEQIIGYEFVKPDVCLLPVSEHNAFVRIDTYVKPSKYLMTGLGIKELIPGDETRTISLPYTPREAAKNELRQKYERGRRANGSDIWICTGLNTANAEDFEFELVNFSTFDLDVTIEIIFDDRPKMISGIIASSPKNSVKKINIAEKSGIITDALFFNHHDFDVKGIPENTDFAIRFMSDRPFVVSGNNNQNIYHF